MKVVFVVYCFVGAFGCYVVDVIDVSTFGVSEFS
jgi:hypothetical protein